MTLRDKRDVGEKSRVSRWGQDGTNGTPPKGGVPHVSRNVSRSQSMSRTLDDLAYRLRRLSPSHRNPHHYHEEKSEIENELRKISKEVLHG